MASFYSSGTDTETHICSLWQSKRASPFKTTAEQLPPRPKPKLTNIIYSKIDPEPYIGTSKPMNGEIWLVYKLLFELTGDVLNIRSYNLDTIEGVSQNILILLKYYRIPL